MALGRNLKVAYMPWKGYNFEDAIVISERIQREDIFTSVHVDEYIMEVRDTKRGVGLTSDIPNVSEDATKDLDANGIIRIGANVHPGDILIGKITPKGESDPSPEEKLLRAIFGDKAGDGKDASLEAQPSLHGVVIDTKLYSRAGKEAKKSKAAEKAMLEKLDEKFAAEIADLTKLLVQKLWSLVQGKTTTGVTDYFGAENLRRRYEIHAEDARRAVASDDRRAHGRPDGFPQSRIVRLDVGRACQRPDRGYDQQLYDRVEEGRRRDQAREVQPHQRRQCRRRASSDGQGLHRQEAQVEGGRQDGRPSRQQGYRGAYRARRGHALSGRRYDRRHLSEPAGRTFANEPRPDLRGRARLGGPRGT